MSALDSTASTTDLLRVQDLKVAFTLQGHSHEVVKGINFRVAQGKVVALVGESGSGKSVTTQAALGLLPKNGTINGGGITFNDPQTGVSTDLAGIPRNGKEMQAIRGARISMIFQEPMTSLSPLHTIGDQVSEALTIHERVDRKTAREKTEAMLALVGFQNPKRAFDMYAFELSGGLRQRAMIAMALICDPALLIADEPTTALDVTIQAQVLALLKRLQRESNMGLLLITHDLGVVANMADEVIVMYHGEIMEAGPVEEIFRRPGHAYLKALLGAVPHFDMKPGERLISLREAGTQQSDLSHVPKSMIKKIEPVPLLQVRDLRKSFTAKKGAGWFTRGDKETIHAVDGISLDVMQGECLGLVGESGCGKTTLSKLIMRAIRPDSGQILLGTGEQEVDLATMSDAELKTVRRRVQMVFQDPANSLSPRMTVLNILREPLEIAGVGDHASRAERCLQLMEAVGLDPRFLGRYPHSFSGGQRQRIGIARALALAPDLLICDEPVSALDVSVQAQILNLINDLRTELGLTYLFISHNLAVIDYVADRIAVMARGQIVELAPRASLFERPSHPYTRALLEAVPYPDLDRPLDFRILEGRDASDPDGWPAAFRSDGGEVPLVAHEIFDNHQVLAHPGATHAELLGA
ncbi:MAG: peptide/nickel transport system ATP-binding protein [Hyphomicrobiaceae bacterium]|jgi:peptide/nickel transport system ATP-binding protein